ncbi:MAG: glycerophosphodiester phosphodiesterase family protein [Pseudomonadota bacterium]
MIRLSDFATACAVAALLAGPASSQTERGMWQLLPGNDLSAMLDCHEAEGNALISAHRGGPSPGLPENGIETMDAVLSAIPAIMEIDVARSPDGVHYLMHDRTLDRTTTGSGSVREVPWSEIKQLNLVDSAGWTTPYRVPTLRAALEWSRGKTVLQIDFKRTASYAEVVELIRETGNENNVILIAYSVAQAQRLHALAPEMLLSVSINDIDDQAELAGAGIPDDVMVAFTGTRIPRPDLYSELDEDDIEVIFGTLGRSPNSIDNVIDRFGTDERYAEIAEGGADVLATDRPREAAAALAAAGRLPEAGACGVGRDR